MKKIKIISTYIVITIIVILLGIFGFTFYYEKTGQAFAITNGSMKPSLDVGDVVFIKPPTEVNTGDIVTLRMGDGSLITHRVVGEKDGMFITQGDANDSPDTFKDVEIIGVVRFHIPVIGRILAIGQSGSYYSDAVESRGEITAATWKSEMITTTSEIEDQTTITEKSSNDGSLTSIPADPPTNLPDENPPIDQISISINTMTSTRTTLVGLEF